MCCFPQDCLVYLLQQKSASPLSLSENMIMIKLEIVIASNPPIKWKGILKILGLESLVGKNPKLMIRGD